MTRPKIFCEIFFWKRQKRIVYTLSMLFRLHTYSSLHICCTHGIHCCPGCRDEMRHIFYWHRRCWTLGDVEGSQRSYEFCCCWYFGRVMMYVGYSTPVRYMHPLDTCMPNECRCVSVTTEQLQSQKWSYIYIYIQVSYIRCWIPTPSVLQALCLGWQERHGRERDVINLIARTLSENTPYLQQEGSGTPHTL